MTDKQQSYQAESIEVLTGLEPVQRRPGMYTETQRPNHLAQEVIDNSVDEALAGYAHTIDVTVGHDQSVTVSDDGRGMPVDVHPEEGIIGLELILCHLHAGGKFSHKNYRYAGGLHGVGVSVVNALSKLLIVQVKRDGQLYEMRFEYGEKTQDLTVIKSVGKRNTGTSIQFWPDERYFESAKLSLSKLQHALRAKAVLCSGLQVRLNHQPTEENFEWQYDGGVQEYLQSRLQQQEHVPQHCFSQNVAEDEQEVEWAVCWLPEPDELIAESYVNLIPTIQGGTHVNGLRSGLLEALKEFCSFHNLLPKGVKLSPEDVWEQCSYVLSVKMREPQFSGQTKERLSSRACANFVSNTVKDAFSLWLNQHVEAGKQIAEMVIARAQKRLKKAKKVVRKKVNSGPALPGKLSDCTVSDPSQGELFLVEGDSAGGSAKQARNRETQAILPLRGKILNTWEIESTQILASQEVHDIAVAIGLDPGAHDLSRLRYGKICILADADSDGAHIATLLCALFARHFWPLIEDGRVFIAMPPLYRIDVGKQTYYALDDDEKDNMLKQIQEQYPKSKPGIQRFKGLGEMSPSQLRETTMAPETRRLVQLTAESVDTTYQLMDKLLAKKRARDRREWLEMKGNLAELDDL